MDLGELLVIPECRVILASKDSLVLRELLDSLAKLVLLDSLALVDPQVSYITEHIYSVIIVDYCCAAVFGCAVVKGQQI